MQTNNAPAKCHTDERGKKTRQNLSRFCFHARVRETCRAQVCSLCLSVCMLIDCSSSPLNHFFFCFRFCSDEYCLWCRWILAQKPPFIFPVFRDQFILVHPPFVPKEEHKNSIATVEVKQSMHNSRPTADDQMEVSSPPVVDPIAILFPRNFNFQQEYPQAKILNDNENLTIAVLYGPSGQIELNGTIFITSSSSILPTMNENLERAKYLAKKLLERKCFVVV